LLSSVRLDPGFPEPNMFINGFRILEDPGAVEPWIITRLQSEQRHGRGVSVPIE
jgi:hypothetical protein